MIFESQIKSFTKTQKISNFFDVFKHNIEKDIDNISLADIILAYDLYFYGIIKNEKMSIFINFGETLDIIVYDPEKTPFSRSYPDYRYTVINTIPKYLEYQFSC